MFATSKGGVAYSGIDEYLGRTAVEKNRIEPRVQVSKGTEALRGTTPTIGYESDGRAYVNVNFTNDLVSVGTQSFDFYLYLVIDGKRYMDDGEGVQVIGSIGNYERDVYGDARTFDAQYKDVLVAREFNNNITVYAGEGVYVKTKLFKDVKYYIDAVRSGDSNFNDTTKQYPDIDNVLTLKSVNFTSSADSVSLSNDYAHYYVYDQDLNPLGRGNDALPFKATYYLANRPLDIEVDVEPVEEPTEEAPLPPAETGGDKAPSNANNNPGTGC
jgi:hypothetical protein